MVSPRWIAWLAGFALLGVVVVVTPRPVVSAAQTEGDRWTPPAAYEGTIRYQAATESWTARVRFVIDPYEAGARSGNEYSLRYHLQPGWPLEIHRMPFVDGSCTATPASIDRVLFGREGTLFVTASGGGYEYAVELWGPTTSVPVTITCPEDYTWVEAVGIGFDLLQEGGVGRLADADGRPPQWLRGTDYEGTFWDLNAQGGEVLGCPQKLVRTGPGYRKLTERMKAALAALYRNLEARKACYRFVMGWRSQQYQDGLRDRWHDIADKRKGDKRTNKQICQALRDAKFAQCPKGYGPPNGNGKRSARGGPAKVSRHTLGQAADIAVTFPSRFVPDVGRYKAAARAAGLCGPPTHDASHVELPYRRTKAKQLVCTAWSRG